MKFIDEAIIDISSGRGGPGAVHFRREKYAPKMGPDGGDGGRGGSCYFEADSNLQSLLDFKFTSRYEAENGKPGEGKDCNGKAGKDMIVRVPVGTVIRDSENGQFLADLLEPGRQVLLLKGGRGGLGNMNFATSVRQAPDFAQPGETGHMLKVALELKLLADVALVGYPNAGKSTLISRWSAARPKIADYPFTTLVPNLGVVRGKSQDFVVADVPGIIEGAHEGKGLGHRFLKHVERSRMLIILLDLDPNTGRQLNDEYNVLMHELSEFSPELTARPKLVVANKADAFGSDPKDEIFQEFLKERGFKKLESELNKTGDRLFLISGVSGYNLEVVKQAVEEGLAMIGPRVFINEVASKVNFGDDEMLGFRKRKITDEMESGAASDEEELDEENLADGEILDGDEDGNEDGNEENDDELDAELIDGDLDDGEILDEDTSR